MSLLPDHLMLLSHNLRRMNDHAAKGEYAEAIVFGTAMVTELTQALDKLTSLAQDKEEQEAAK